MPMTVLKLLIYSWSNTIDEEELFEHTLVLYELLKTCLPKEQQFQGQKSAYLSLPSLSREVS